jgi:hypothetical protein
MSAWATSSSGQATYGSSLLVISSKGWQELVYRFNRPIKYRTSDNTTLIKIDVASGK